MPVDGARVIKLFRSVDSVAILSSDKHLLLILVLGQKLRLEEALGFGPGFGPGFGTEKLLLLSNQHCNQRLQPKIATRSKILDIQVV